MIFLAKMYSAFLFAWIVLEKVRNRIVHGILIATRDGGKYFTIISRKQD